MNYNEAPGLRWSDLRAALDSPLHLRHQLDAPRVDRPAFRLGRAEHAAILEPDVFDRDCVIVPAEFVTGSGGLSSSKKATAWLEEAGSPDLLLTEAEWDNACRMVDAVYTHPTASEWMRQSTIREQAVFWTDTIDGIECKAKPDLVAPGLGMMIDLKRKTPRGGINTVRSCVSELVSRHYIGQLGYYLRGWLSDLERVHLDRIGWIFVTPSAPYDVICVYADEEMLGYGAELAEKALRVYADGLTTGDWHGVAPLPVEVSLPAYLRDDGDVADLGLTGLEVRTDD